MKEREVFDNALAIVSPEDRSRYLDEACVGNERLRGHIEGLIEAYGDLGSFLESPPVGNASPTVDRPISEKPGTVIGPYKLLQQVGEGGMGMVFMAEQTEPIQRPVALKIIKPGMDTRQVIARFEAERQALALMDHPNIARVLDAGATDTGRPYFVMDLVKGVPITEYCDHQHLSVRQRLELMAAVCHAVQHAHQKGIIHRDIKPSNVLVAEYDGKPVPKVIDFGVAKATAQRLTERTMFTQYGQIVGTFEYMSPEQARFNQLDIDTRSDIYSLGVLLYEVLAGSTPLEKERLRSAAYDEVLRIICEEEPPRPSTRLSSLSLRERAGERVPTGSASIAANRSVEPKQLTNILRGELDWIVMKCLEKDRNRRYETANGLSMDLQRYLSDEPVEACPPSAVYRFRKFARRNKTGLAISGLILFFFTLMGGGVGWAARNRAVRQAALEQGVTSALDEVSASHQHENWPAAMAAVTRAEGLLATGDAAPSLSTSVKKWRSDLETIVSLEDIRLSDAMTEQGFRRERPALDANYQREFGVLGIDIDAMTIKDAADRIRARPIRDQLIAALDGWTKLRMVLVNDKSDVAREKPGDWRVRPLRVARASDTDEFRNRVRLAIEQGDAAKQIELAQSPDATRLPASTLELLSERLATADARNLQMELLKRAQQARPDDFYLNFVLAISRPLQSEGATFRSFNDGPIAFRPVRNDLLLGDEAFVYAMAAVALRPRNAYARVALAETLWRAGRLDDALSAYREAIRLKPDEFRAHGNLALILAQQGKLDEAIAIYRIFIDRQPDNVVAHSNLGGLLHQVGKLDEAIAIYRKAIELDPDDAFAYKKLGSALTDQRKFEEAVTACRKAIELEPTDAIAYCNLGFALQGMGKLDEAVAACRKAIELKPADFDAAVAYYTLGNALCEQGKLEESIAACRKAIELDPACGAAYNNLGSALNSQGNHEAAITAFRKAIELKPTLPVAYVNLGSVLDDLGKYDEAITAFHKAIELKPNYSEAYNNLGLALQHSGKLDEAVAAYRKAIELWPNNVDAYLNLGYVLHDLQRFEESIAASRKAIELKPNDFEAYNNLGATLKDYGKLDDAIAAHRKAIELDPAFAEAYNNLAAALIVQGKFDEAVTACRKAIELKFERFEVYANLGLALLSQGKTGEAIAAYRKAIELQPSDFGAYNNLASLLATAPAPHRDPAHALELATRATELGPTEGAAWNTLGIARYRVGQWQPAIDALEKSMKLRAGGDANDWYILAMAHWQLGHKDEARQWYDKAVEWTEKNEPKNEELRRFHAEAAKLLGITEPQTTDN